MSLLMTGIALGCLINVAMFVLTIGLVLWIIALFFRLLVQRACSRPEAVRSSADDIAATPAVHVFRRRDFKDTTPTLTERLIFSDSSDDEDFGTGEPEGDQASRFGHLGAMSPTSYLETTIGQAWPPRRPLRKRNCLQPIDKSGIDLTDGMSTDCESESEKSHCE